LRPGAGAAGLERARGLFLEALAAHEQRDFGRAVDLLKEALEIVPDRVSVLSNLGAALVELGRAEEAQAYVARALESDPAASDLYTLMARVLEARGNPREALVHLTRGHVLVRGDADAYADHGMALLGAGRRIEAGESFDRAIALDPRCVSALVNRAAMWLEQGDAANAVDSLDRALKVDPGNAHAWINRGIGLDRLGRHDDALAAYDRALGLSPGHSGAWNNRGNTLMRLHRHAEALAAFDTALEIDPRHVEAWSNRGLALSALKRDSEALACFEKAISVQPGLAEAWSNRGRALVNLGRPEEAVGALDRALAINPALADAWLNRGNAQYQLKHYDRAVGSYEQAMALQPDIDHALGGWIHSKAMLCDWAGLEEAVARAGLAILAGRNVANPFQTLVAPLPRETQRMCAELCMMRNFPPSPKAASLPGAGQGRIRIGYFSADFRDHPVGYQLRGLLRWHDRACFELIGFSLRPGTGDAFQDALRGGLDRFHDLSELAPDAAMDLARAERLDIAVDLTGYTAGSRMELFAGRLAPIQVNYLCPGTSGAPYVDYIVADAVTIPEAHDAGYSESVVRLPESFFIADYHDLALTRGASRVSEGLPEDGIVFASFCESYKITPQVWDVWMRLLRQIPGSVLWMGIRSNAMALENLRREAGGHGVEPRRIVVAGFAPKREDHLARLALADLCLDTPVYNGHTTTADALWAGVPVLSAPGGSFCGRVAASILHAARLPELVARDLAEYEAIALRLARSPAELASLRERLARDKGTLPLFHTEFAVRHVETAFRTMVERQRKGLPPESFSVPAA
jgi:predicted O-linked N-acetylglucosamine transferase (SPINDLY family)